MCEYADVQMKKSLNVDVQMCEHADMQMKKSLNHSFKNH